MHAVMFFKMASLAWGIKGNMSRVTGLEAYCFVIFTKIFFCNLIEREKFVVITYYSSIYIN